MNNIVVYIVANISINIMETTIAKEITIKFEVIPMAVINESNEKIKSIKM